VYVHKKNTAETRRFEVPLQHLKPKKIPANLWWQREFQLLFFFRIFIMHLFLAAMKNICFSYHFFCHTFEFFVVNPPHKFSSGLLYGGAPHKKRMNPGTLQHESTTTTSTVAPTEGKEKSPHEQ